MRKTRLFSRIFGVALVLVMIGAMLGGLPVSPAIVGASEQLNAGTPPEGYIPTPTVEKFGQTDALLIQDKDVWGRNSNELALIEAGISYDLRHSCDLSTIDLSEYKFIIYSSDQTQEYYGNIEANIDKIESFVSNGGLLIAHVCDEAWTSADWSGMHILPGNVQHATGIYLEDLAIADTSHPIVRGTPVGNFDILAANPEYFDGWGHSTHGYLTNVLNGTVAVIKVVGGAHENESTYIDYDFGKGKVLATMQTVEWGYGDGVNSNCWAGPRPELLRNEMRYALKWESEVGVKTLPVPYYSQGATDWCVPTSMSMILSYYGKNIHSWDIARDWSWGREIPEWDWPWNKWGGRECGYFEANGLDTYLDRGAVSFETVKEWIDAGMPVLLAMLHGNMEHAVVITGYDLRDGHQRVYVSDPAGTLLLERGVVSTQETPIRVLVDWDRLVPYIDWVSYAIAVAGTPCPPKGTIDIDMIFNMGFCFSYEEEYKGLPLVFSWACGGGAECDEGMIWRFDDRFHPSSLSEKDSFRYDRSIANHMEDEQAYVLEVEFVQDGYSATHVVPVTVDGSSREDEIMKEPISLRNLLGKRVGRYVVNLTLWNEDCTEKYDEIKFPSVDYTVLIEFYLCSPADLYVTDPDGLRIGIDPSTGEEINEIAGAAYTGPGSEPQVVAIPDRKIGDYLVDVIPHPAASLTDTYSLEVRADGVTTSLAENVEIGNIPARPYIVRSTETELIPIIPATGDFDPDALNLRSKGTWVTVYTELPVGHGYNITDIDVSTIMVNGTILVDPCAPWEIRDYDDNGVPDLMVKFGRANVIDYIIDNVNMTQLMEERFMTLTLTLTGKVDDGTPFQGTITINIIWTRPGRGNTLNALPR